MNQRRSILLITGSIATATTILVLALMVTNWAGIMPTAALFMVFSVVAFFGGMYLIEERCVETAEVLFRSSGMTVVSVYCLFSFLISLLFLNLFKFNGKLFWVIQVVLLASATILLLIFFSAGNRHKQSNEVSLSEISSNNSLIHRLSVLATDKDNTNYSGDLTKLVSDLRYGDTSTIVPVDSDIENLILSLEKELSTDEVSDPTIQNILATLQSMIAQRKLEMITTKKGRL